jgi:hypothetical protein
MSTHDPLAPRFYLMATTVLSGAAIGRHQVR